MTFPWHAPKYLAFSRGGDVSGRPSVDDTAAAYLNRFYGPEDHVEAYADLYGRNPAGYDLHAATRGIPGPYYGRQPDEDAIARVMRSIYGHADGGYINSYPGFDDPSRIRYFEDGGEGLGGGGGTGDAPSGPDGNGGGGRGGEGYGGSNSDSNSSDDSNSGVQDPGHGGWSALGGPTADNPDDSNSSVQDPGHGGWSALGGPTASAPGMPDAPGNVEDPGHGGWAALSGNPSAAPTADDPDDASAPGLPGAVIGGQAATGVLAGGAYIDAAGNVFATPASENSIVIGPRNESLPEADFDTLDDIPGITPPSNTPGMGSFSISGPSAPSVDGMSRSNSASGLTNIGNFGAGDFGTNTAAGPALGNGSGNAFVGGADSASLGQGVAGSLGNGSGFVGGADSASVMGGGGGWGSGRGADSGASEVGRAAAPIGKNYSLSSGDVSNMAALARDEAANIAALAIRGGTPPAQAYRDAYAHVIATVLNRAASGKRGFGAGNVTSVMNQKSQFEGVKSKARGDVGNFTRASPEEMDAINDILSNPSKYAQYMQTTHFVNPHVRGAPGWAKGWNAAGNGPRQFGAIGSGRTVHYYGNADQNTIPSYSVTLPNGQTVDMVGGFGGGSARTQSDTASAPTTSYDDAMSGGGETPMGAVQFRADGGYINPYPGFGNGRRIRHFEDGGEGQGGGGGTGEGGPGGPDGNGGGGRGGEGSNNSASDSSNNDSGPDSSPDAPDAPDAPGSVEDPGHGGWAALSGNPSAAPTADDPDDPDASDDPNAVISGQSVTNVLDGGMPNFGTFQGPASAVYSSGLPDAPAAINPGFGQTGFGNFGASPISDSGVMDPLGGISTGKGGGIAGLAGTAAAVGGNNYGGFGPANPDSAVNAPGNMAIGTADGPTFAEGAYNGIGANLSTTSPDAAPPDFGTGNEATLPNIDAGFDAGSYLASGLDAIGGFLSSSFNSILDSAAQSRAAAEAARNAAFVQSTPEFDNNDPFAVAAAPAPVAAAQANPFANGNTPAFVQGGLTGWASAPGVSVPFSDMGQQNVTVPGLSAKDGLGTFGVQGPGFTLNDPSLSQSGRFGGVTTADEGTTYTDGRSPGNVTVSGTVPGASAPASTPTSPDDTVDNPEADLIAGTYTPKGSWTDPLTGTRYSSNGDKLLGNGMLQSGVGVATNVLSGLNPVSAIGNLASGLLTGNSFGGWMSSADPFTDPNAGIGSGGTNGGGGGSSDYSSAAASAPAHSSAPPASSLDPVSGVNPIVYNTRKYTGFPGDPKTFGMRSGNKSFYDHVNLASGGRVGALNMIKAMTSR
jgi:hypothetical protein